MMIGVLFGIDPGPGSRADVTFGLDRKNPERLHVDHRRGGCVSILGAGLLAVGLALQAEGLGPGSSTSLLAWGLILGLLGAFLLFARLRTTIDRAADVLEQGVLLGRMTIIRRTPLSLFDRLELIERVDVSHDEDGKESLRTTFRLELKGGQEEMEVASAGAWEASIPIAEAVGRFLGLPVHDRAAQKIRRPEQLDLSLREQGLRGAKKPTARRAEVGYRCTIDDDDDDDDDEGRLVITIPRPDGRPILAILVLVLLGWALPVGLLSRSAFVTLLPVVVVVTTWVKVAFGFFSKVEATPEMLTVHSRGLIVRRSVEFPTSELEDLELRQFEWGGPRTTLAQMFDGCLVARSDRTSIRFGHGLARAELEWLRGRLLEVVTSGTALTAGLNSSTHGRIPLQAQTSWSAMVGVSIGITLAHIIGGPLAVCVKIPFLEHVVGVGAIIGLVAGLILFNRGSAKRSSRPLLWAVSTLVILGAMLVFSPAHWLQAAPSFDEARILAQGLRPRGFWIGWMVTGAIANGLLVAVVFPLLALVVRAVKKI